MVFLYVITILTGLIILLFALVLGPSFFKYMFMSMLKKDEFKILHSKVLYLSERPIINGVINKSLKQLLPARKFNIQIKWLPFNKSIDATYRLAYGSEFLYLYIEADSDSIVCRDRGYQNGDGFHILLAVPQPDNGMTDQFYVFGFSAQTDPKAKWAQKVIWYHDIDVALARLGDEVEFEVKAQNEKIGFELLLPWKAVYPYHPWISDSIGFNLGFVKAVGKSGMNYHLVVWDWRMQMEQQKRKYARLSFDVPKNNSGNQTYLVMERNSVEGNKVKGKVATLSAATSSESWDDNLTIEIKSQDGLIEKTQQISYRISDVLTTMEVEIQSQDLAPGSYTIHWQSMFGQGETELTIFPEFDYNIVTKYLEGVRGRISEESFNTLQYKTIQLHREIESIKPYDVYPTLGELIEETKNFVQRAEKGEDVLASQSGYLRRAFFSRIDDSLQPYSVKIPEKYNSSKKYPLVVFLHGSGRDDKGILKLHSYISRNEYIQLAPRARGTSNYYGTEHAQIDIQEALDDVINSYSIDTKKIILTGFSMGGYGVYRTFLQMPDRFTALAVFSGEVKAPFFFALKNGKYPNVLKKNIYEQFIDIPIFIYHGGKDRNCPFENTVELVKKLQPINENVEFQFDDDAGHNQPGDSVVEAYNKWLRKIVSG